MVLELKHAVGKNYYSFLVVVPQMSVSTGDLIPGNNGIFLKTDYFKGASVSCQVNILTC